MPLSRMNEYSSLRGMRRNRLPGTRNPFSVPLSKQRMIVCWLTLQIFAASPVVNTVFVDMAANHPSLTMVGPANGGSQDVAASNPPCVCHVEASPKGPSLTRDGHLARKPGWHTPDCRTSRILSVAPVGKLALHCQACR